MKVCDKFKVIIEKTRVLFFQFGIKNISMDEIARKQGISKKTLYNYVSNKSDLLTQIFDYTLSEIEDLHKELENEKNNAIDILLKTSKLITDKLKSSNPSLVFELQKYFNEEYSIFLKKRHSFMYDKIMTNITQGIKEGLYRRDLHKELVVSLYIKSIEDLGVSTTSWSKNTYTLSEIFEVMFENHVRGISTIKGIEYYEQAKSNLQLTINN